MTGKMIFFPNMIEYILLNFFKAKVLFPFIYILLKVRFINLFKELAFDFMILFYHFFLFSLTCVVLLFWLLWLWFLFLVLRWNWHHWMKSSLIIAVKCYVNFILNTTLAASRQVLVHVFLLLLRSLPISKYLEIFLIFFVILLQYLFSQKIYSKWIQFYLKNWELFFDPDIAYFDEFSMCTFVFEWSGL